MGIQSENAIRTSFVKIADWPNRTISMVAPFDGMKGWLAALARAFDNLLSPPSFNYSNSRVSERVGGDLEKPLNLQRMKERIDSCCVVAAGL